MWLFRCVFEQDGISEQEEDDHNMHKYTHSSHFLQIFFFFCNLEYLILP